MVVILLLTPPYTQHDGCDGAGSNDSSTSTGETAISANTYKVHSQQQQQNHYLPSKNVWKQFTNKPQQQPKQYHFPNSSHSSSYNINNSSYSVYPQSFAANHWNCRCQFCNNAPVLPKSQQPPSYDTYYKWSSINDTAVNRHADGNHDYNHHNDDNYVGPANNMPHMQPDKSFYNIQDQWFNDASNTNHVTFPPLTHVTPKRQKHRHQQVYHQEENVDNRSYRPRQVDDSIEFYKTKIPTFSHFNNFTTNTRNNTTSDYVRHVTRVNFYDVDTSQVEFNSKDNNNNNNNNEEDNVKEEGDGKQPLDTEAITKEGKFHIDFIY